MTVNDREGLNEARVAHQNIEFGPQTSTSSEVRLM